MNKYMQPLAFKLTPGSLLDVVNWRTLQRDVTILFHSPYWFILTCFDPLDKFVAVTPYNPASGILGKQLEQQIRSKLELGMHIYFVGSNYFQIPGITNDIDLLAEYTYPRQRKQYEAILVSLFGPPLIKNSRYIKWTISKEGKDVEIILGHRTNRMFRWLLTSFFLQRDNPRLVEEYMQMKLASDGVSMREYSRRQMHFFQKVRSEHNAPLIANHAPVVLNSASSGKSLFEYVNLTTLWVIGKFISVFPSKLGFHTTSTILCYHSVSDNGWRWSTRINDFKQQLAYIHQDIVPISDLASSNPAKGVAITFDDGYLDVFTNAFPLLESYTKTACMFVIGDADHPDRGELGNDLPLLSIAQIQTLHKAGWEIGYHTNTHRDLRALTDKELDEEIGIGKRNLEKRLGFRLRYFAYPRGLYSPKILAALTRADFDAAFTVEGRRKNREHKYKLSRLPLEGTYTFEQFQALLSVPGQWVTEWFIKILEQKEAVMYTIKKFIRK